MTATTALEAKTANKTARKTARTTANKNARTTASKTARPVAILAVLGLLGGAVPAAAQEAGAAGPGRGNQEFIGVDLDTGGVHYDGRDSGRFCLYRTVEVFNRVTGYVEPRRVRRCGRGLYLR